MNGLVDKFGRRINYLRISVTDRCNFRCTYCMPEEGVRLESRLNILTFEEITKIAQVAVANGVTNIRLTGGEPLVRRDLPKLVYSLSAIPGLSDLSLTTNASLLSKYAQTLADSGLKRVNISLDTVNPDTFHRITRFGALDDVWEGILAAENAGFNPIKINVVVMKGVNDQELLELAKITMNHPWQVRFIELMPFEHNSGQTGIMGVGDDLFFSVQEMKERLESLRMVPIDKKSGGGPSRNFKIQGSLGTVGFISPIGDHFCSTCNRIRLTADGKLRPCLLNDTEVMLREPLRRNEDILPYLVRAVEAKPERHNLETSQLKLNRKMSQIGG